MSNRPIMRWDLTPLRDLSSFSLYLSLYIHIYIYIYQVWLVDLDSRHPIPTQFAHLRWLVLAKRFVRFRLTAERNAQLLSGKALKVLVEGQGGNCKNCFFVLVWCRICRLGRTLQTQTFQLAQKRLSLTPKNTFSLQKEAFPWQKKALLAEKSLFLQNI